MVDASLPIMIDLHQIIAGLYVDKSYHEIKDLLEEQNMYIPLKKCTILLNEALATEKKVVPTDLRSIQIGHIASLILVSVNEKLKTIKIIDKRSQLEEILSSICRKILQNFLSQTKSDISILTYQLMVALQDSCTFHDYDYQKLDSFLGLEGTILKMVAEKKPNNVIMPKTSPPVKTVPGYWWKGAKNDKPDFIELVADVTNEKKKTIHKLFDKPTERLNLNFNASKANYILHFFSKTKGQLIGRHGTGYGYYQVLGFHVLDFEEKFLKYRPAREIINLIKNNRSKYQENEEKFDKMLTYFVKPKT